MMLPGVLGLLLGDFFIDLNCLLFFMRECLWKIRFILWLLFSSRMFWRGVEGFIVKETVYGDVW